MTSSLLLTLATTYSAAQVLAAGGFPPIETSFPCGLDPADASCAALFRACIQARPPDSDPLSDDFCAAAASCFPVSVDRFLSGFYCNAHGPHGPPPQSISIARMSDEVYGKLSVRGQNVTWESYSQWYTQQASAADPGVTSLIDLALVKESFDIISAWTGFCATRSIAKSNFLDWFQYSSTVPGAVTTCHTVDNCPKSLTPYSQDLTVACAYEMNALDDPFSVPSCVAGALSWDAGVNSFLQAVTCRHNIKYNENRPPPVGTSVPALTRGMLSPSPFTQQNFVDFVYGQLSSVAASVRWPIPDATQVINRWSVIAAWTDFCATRAIPQPNLSDFLRYSAVALNATTCANPQCPADPNPSCEQLFQSCISHSNVLTDAYANADCALAASCRQGGVTAFANAISCAINTQANPRTSRLDVAVFSALSFGDTTISQQNYIDSYYGALSRLPNPTWPDVSYVIGKWDTIKSWTAFPNGEVPYQNFADFLQYS